MNWILKLRSHEIFFLQPVFADLQRYFLYFKWKTTHISKLFENLLNGQSNEIFDLQFFFIIRTCLGHWPMG